MPTEAGKTLCSTLLHTKSDGALTVNVALLQLERAEVRLEGIDTILKLAAKSFLLPSVQYAMFCGWQRLIPEGIDIG